MLNKILEEIETMHYNAEAISRGLEDECITDRYAAAAYGYNEAVKRIAEIIRCHNGGWIPVGDRLPGVPPGADDLNCPEFNVTVKGADVATTLKCDPNGTWFDDDGYVYPVIAWQPLPEPYRPEK